MATALLILTAPLLSCALSVRFLGGDQTQPPTPDLAAAQEQEDLNDQAQGALTRAALALTARRLAVTK